jgi:hypothetical protein
VVIRQGWESKECFLASALIWIPRAVIIMFFHHVVSIYIPVLVEAILYFFFQMFTYITRTSYSLFTLLNIVNGIRSTCVVSVKGACVQKSRHNVGKDRPWCLSSVMSWFFSSQAHVYQSRLLHESIFQMNFYVFPCVEAADSG